MFPSDLICYILAKIPNPVCLRLNKEINQKRYAYWLNITNKQKIFMKAIRVNKYEIVKLLLPHVDPTAQYNYAIIWASIHGNNRCVDLLLRDGRSDPADQNNNAIMCACEYGHCQCVDLLLKDGRSDPTDCNNEAIRCASRRGRDQCVDLLLKDGRSDPTACNNEAIRVARRLGHSQCVDLLLKDGRVISGNKNMNT